MKSSRLISRAAVFSVIFGLAAACTSTVPATVTRRAAVPIDPEAKVHLIARRQHAAVAAALEKAGIQIATDFRDSGYALEVKIGSSRGSGDCGSIRNVAYTLRGYGQRLIVLKGRGPLGECDSSILDDMSRELVENMN